MWKKNRATLGCILAFVGFMTPGSSGAITLGPGPLEFGSPDRLEFGLYRFEKPSFWWVNLGVPDGFMMNVPGLEAYPRVLPMRGVEYGVGVSAWPWDRAQVRVRLPIESNRFVAADGLLHRMARPGDLQTGASLLVFGRRETPFRLAADGWFSWPTGSSPFGLNDPILASGRGVAQAAAGVWASETSGRFSFFQWIHYEKEGKVYFDRWQGVDIPPSEMRWPFQAHAGTRFEYKAYRRGSRWVGLAYELRFRWLDDLLWNGEQKMPPDRFVYSTVALKVRVDPQMTLEGRWTFFPLELGSTPRLDYGSYITVVLSYHPLARSSAGPSF